MLQQITLTLLTIGSLAVQQDDASDTQANTSQPPLLSLSDLSIQHYTPVHVEGSQLYELAEGMVGRNFYLKERGGWRGDPVSNLTVVGETLLLYDTEEYLKRMQQTLIAIDLPSVESTTVDEDPVITFHYAPRHLSRSDLRSILPGMSRNAFMANERNFLVVRDKASVVAELKTLLEEVDVPADQVLVTAYLVRGWTLGDETPSLPTELTEHLSRLVPGLPLEFAGFAMLRSTVMPVRSSGSAGVYQGPPLKLKLTGSGPSEDYLLSFRPSAYDRETGTLTVEDCQLNQQVETGLDGVFSTNTVFRGDEYTVLGATGAKPIFVVVRLTRV